MKTNLRIWLSLLLLGLLIIALVDKAHASFPPLPEGGVVFWSKTGSLIYFSHQGYKDPQDGLRPQAEQKIPACQLSYPDMECLVQGYNDDPIQGAAYTWGGGGHEMHVTGRVRVVAIPREPCAQRTHEGGVPDGAECGVCSEGFIPATGAYDPESGSGTPAPAQCMRNREPGECKLEGLFEVQTDQGAYCVPECQGIGLDGFCIDEVEKDPDEPQCGPDHPDFKGVAGYGGEAVLVCGEPENNCPSDFTWGVVQKGNTTVESCFPNAYNPPKCSGTDVLTQNQWGGFACLPLRKPGDDDQPGGPNDPNNGDSDGDGQGDITGITGQLQDIKKLLGRGNTNTDNINETLKGIGKQIKDGTKAITDAIGNIPGGGGGGGNGNGSGGGDGDGEDPAINWSGNAIDTELTDPTDDYDQVMADYQAKINDIKGEVRALFSTNLSGGGTIEDNIKTIKGVEVNFSLNRFLGGLDILGAIVLFCAAFISAGILFTSRG